MHKSGDSRSHHSVTFRVHPNQSNLSVAKKEGGNTSSRAPLAPENVQKHPEKCTCCCCSCATKTVCLAFGIIDGILAVCRITLSVVVFYFLHPLRDDYGHTEKEHEREVKKYKLRLKNNPEVLDRNWTDQMYIFDQHREAHYANIGLASFETYILAISAVSIIYAAIRYSSSLCKLYMGLKLFLVTLNILHLVTLLVITSNIREAERTTDLIFPIVIQFEAVFYLIGVRFAYQLKLATAFEELEEPNDEESLETSASIVLTSSRKILRLLERTQETANESVALIPHNDAHHPHAKDASRNQKSS